MLVQPRGEIRRKKLAGLRLQYGRVIRQKLQCDLKHLFRRRKQPRVPRDTTHKIRVAVVHLTPDHIMAKRVRTTCDSGWLKVALFNAGLLLELIALFICGSLLSQTPCTTGECTIK